MQKNFINNLIATYSLVYYDLFNIVKCLTLFFFLFYNSNTIRCEKK